jgi:uncharacterized repeat protein (TIGR02543 family)
MNHRQLLSILCAAIVIACGLLLGAPSAVQAGVYDSDTEVTYKEYWVPHSEFKGGRNDAQFGCVDTHPNGYAYYLEPTGNCTKTVRINIPDNFANALKVELYLDLWRNHVPPSAQFTINGGPLRSTTVGYDWSRSPYVVEIPKSELVQGVNVVTFREVEGQYHIHDIAFRIYFDTANPLRDSNNNLISAPQGNLVNIWADNGVVAANTGGNLTVNDDQLVLTANVSSPAKFVEFHGYYDGYDEDNDGTFVDWHNRTRNNFHPGGLGTLGIGGTTDHIGSVLTPTPGQYSIWWSIPHIVNQNNVKFKIRIVDENYVVREAAGGVSALFHLTRSQSMVSYYRPNFPDAILYSGGSKPLSVTRTVNLPSNIVVTDYQKAFFIGSYWENPYIAINNNSTFRAFPIAPSALEDTWALSIREANPTWFRPGTNNIVYTHNNGFGEFIEKPGPLIVFKKTTQIADTAAPTITSRTPAANATNVAANSNIVVRVADPGRGVNFNRLKMRVNGVPIAHQLTGSPDEYTLTYDPTSDFLPGSLVTVRIEACDFAGNCLNPSNYSFTVAEAALTLTTSTVGDGTVAVDPAQATYSYGEVITITATPNTGAEFSAWNASMIRWWDTAWRYRVPVTVHTGDFIRYDKPVETPINFTTLLNSVSQAGSFDPNALRVVEIDAAGQVLDDHVPVQFDRASDYQAGSNATGTLTLIMKGTTPANSERTYHVYFDVTARNLPATTLGDQVIRTDTVDEFQGSYRIQTNNATYDYHVQGGGFSSMIDIDGNDWLDYHDSPPDAGGAFRGTPNMVPPPDGLFHPGKSEMITYQVYSGPLKETFRSRTYDNQWEVQWDIYPTYAKMTVLRRDPTKNYWWLFEGTPGGRLENTGAANTQDFVTLSNGTTFLTSSNYEGDLQGDEWVFISDPDVDNASTAARSVFLVNADSDTAVDSYRTLESGGNKKMTIWGFGRNRTNNTTYLNQTPKRFYIGLMDTTAYAAGSNVINSAFKDLSVTVGAAQRQNATYDAGASSSFTLTIVSNAAVTATFAPEGSQLALTVNVVGNGTVSKSPNQALYAPGQQVTLTPLPEPGWAFSGWSGNLSGSANPATITMDSDKTVTATFVQVQYTVFTNVTGNGSITKSPNKTLYNFGEDVTLTATPAAGFYFTSWSGDLSGAANPTTITVDGNKSITANFAPIQYAVTVNIVGGGTVTTNPNQPTHNSGSTVTLTATPDPGYAFTGWSGDLTGTTNPASLVMNGNKTVTATFTPIGLFVTTRVRGNGEIIKSPDKPAYVINDVITVTAVADAGWAFSGWSGDLSGTANPSTLTVNSNKTITATFTVITYTLATTVVGNGTLVPDPAQASYVYGDLVLLTATPAPGYVFTGWSGNLSGTINPATLTMDGSKVVTATFAQVQYTVAVTATGNGTVSQIPQQTTYLHNDVVTLTAAPAPGWSFTGWSGSLTGSTNPITLTVDSNKAITATFTELLFTLSTNVSGDGALIEDPAQSVYRLGEVVTLTAVADTGSIFTGWSGDLSGNTTPITLVMDSNKTVTATFAAIPYTLNTPVVGTGQVNKNPDQPAYLYGNSVTLTATPGPGWFFTAWSGPYGSQNPLTVSIQDNTTITATFTDKPLTINTSTMGNGAVTKNPNRNYAPGEQVTLTAFPEPGWVFTGWSGDVTSSTNPLQVTVDGNKNITATFMPQNYTLTISTSGSGSVTKAPDKAGYADGEQVTLTATPADGWTFTGWSGDVVSGNNPLILDMDGDKNMIATFSTEPGTLTTSVTGNGRILVEPKKTLYSPGEVITLTAVPDVDWGFTGWSGALSGMTNPAVLTMGGDKNVQAAFAALPNNGQARSDDFNRCALNTNVWRWLNPAGDGTMEVTGEQLKLIVPANATHDLWNTNADAPQLVQTVQNQDFDLRVKFDSAVSSRYQMQGVVVKEDAQNLLRINVQSDGSRTNLFIARLRGSAQPTTIARPQVPNGAPIYLRVLRTGSQWSVSYGTDGVTWSTTQTFTQAMTVTEVGLFVGNANSSGAIPAHTAVIDSFINILQPLSYQADDPLPNFVPVTVVGEGSVQRAASCGNPAQLTATPQPGWIFVDWRVVGPGEPQIITDNPATIEFGRRDQVTATFRQGSGYRLTTQVTGQGTVQTTPVKTEYTAGESVTLTATPADGWAFVGWSGGLTGSANPATVTMSSDKNITALFAKKYTVLITPAVNGNVQVEPQKPFYVEGDQVTFTAIPNVGYQFVEWLVNGAPLADQQRSSQNPLTLTVTENITVEARFIQANTALYMPVIVR